MKTKSMLILVLTFLIGCTTVNKATNLTPELKNEIAAKSQNRAYINFKYYKPSIFYTPGISDEEIPLPSEELQKAGDNLLHIITEKLKKNGFTVYENKCSYCLELNTGFAYKKGILLLQQGQVTSRMTVNWISDSQNHFLFTITSDKRLNILIGGGTYSEEKGEDLAETLVEKLIEELQKIIKDDRIK